MSPVEQERRASAEADRPPLDRNLAHRDLIQRILTTGARIKYLFDGDVAGAIMAASEENSVDGEIFGRLRPRDQRERAAAVEAGHDVDRILTTSDLVWGEDVFFAATGVTDGELLRGVRIRPPYVLTRSLSMRSRSGAVRVIIGHHHSVKSNLIHPS